MRSNRFGSWLLVAFATLAVLAGGVALAQEQVGTIEGIVADKDGAVLPGVTVEAVSAGGATLVAVTDINGAYRFPRLASSTYKLTAKLDGFVTAEVPNIDLTLGKALKINFTMQPGTFQDTITVAADTVAIDVSQSSTATSISREQLDLLPRGRDFTSVVAQAAGASNESMAGGISVDGASGSENRFVIDGVDTTHPQDGVSGQGLITDFLEEVQVKSAGYAAEYGGSLGGVINAITKTGGNDFHGWVGAYYGDSSFNGDVRPTPYNNNCPPNGDCTITYKKDDQTRIEPGFAIGGPILRDKLWFYLGYQPTLVSTDRTPNATASVPNPATYSQDQTFNYFSGNIKGNLGSNFLYKVAANLSPSETKKNLPAQDGSTPVDTNLDITNKFPRESYSLYMDFIPSQNFLLSGRLGYFKTDTNTSGVTATTRYFFRSGSNPSAPYPDPTSPLYRPVGFSSVPAASFNSTDFDKWVRQAASVDGSFFFNLAGSHAAKVGMGYEKITNDVATGEHGNLFEIRWLRPDRFGAGVIGTYGSVHVRRFGTFGGAESFNYSVFAQDSWSITKNFTINYGVRAEKEQVPNYGAAADPTLPKWAIEFNYGDKIAPRLGFAWDVMGDQKLKVYGSFGEYYDITKLEMPRGSFGGDKWIAYLYPLNTLDWTTLPNGCHTSTNVASDNPCPNLGTPVTRDLRHPTDPRTAIDPDLKPMENREYQIGGDFQLTPKSVIGARYVNKSLINTIEDIGYLDAEGNEIYTTGNPGKGLVACHEGQGFPCPDYPQAEAKRDYQALELTYDKRFVDNWSLRASYTYSKLEGNYSGLASSDEIIATAGQARTDPNVARYFDGLVYGYDTQGNIVNGVLNTDRPHQVKIQGIYRTPWNMSFGVNQIWMSGTPTTTIAYYNGVDFFPNGRNDQGRNGDTTQTDLFISQPFKLGGLQLEANINVINLFDESAVQQRYTYKYSTDICDAAADCDTTNEWYFRHLVPYNYDTVMAGQPLDPQYLRPYSWQGARTVRLGVKLSF